MVNERDFTPLPEADVIRQTDLPLADVVRQTPLPQEDRFQQSFPRGGRRGGGGGGGGGFSAEAISAREAAARQASKKFQDSERIRIEKEFKQDRSNLNKEFRETLSRTKDPRERKNITTEFFIKGRDLVNQRSLDRVAAGIIKSFTVGGQRITAETVKGFKAPIITSAQQEKSLGRLERGEIESLTIGGQRITKETLPEFRQALTPRLITPGIIPTIQPKVIDIVRDQDFNKIKAPLRIRIEKFIRKNIPGGATIIRNLKAGTETLKDIEKRFPVIEDLTTRPAPVPEGFVDISEETPSFPPRRETIQTDKKIREQTIIEKLGLEDTKATDDLKISAEKIQSDFLAGTITEDQANIKLDDEVTNFITKQSIKEIPMNVGAGLAVAVLSGIPGVNLVLAPSLIGLALLNRRKLVSKFRNFPKASAIETASFLAGGLGGSILKGKITGLAKADINPANVRSLTKIIGKQKNDLINFALKEGGSSLRLGKDKITSTNTYEIVMADGRTYRMVEFTKTQTIPGRPSIVKKDIIGFQTKSAVGERVIGKGFEVITDGTSQTFIRILRYRPQNPQISKALKDFGFKKAKLIDVVEKSRVIKDSKGVSQILSQSRVLAIKSADKNLIQRIQSVERKIQSGQKVGILES